MTERPNTEPKTLSYAEIIDLIGPEPAWVECAKCGSRTSRSPCWTCTAVHEANRDRMEAIDLALATIPERYRWARIGDMRLRQRVRTAEALDTLIPRVLAARHVVFAGASGTGKTSLACACLTARIAPGVAFVSALTLRSARIQHAAGDGEPAIVEGALRAPLLLIDEIGQRAPHATDATPDVIFGRHDADRATWVTTGLTGDQLVEMYGKGFVRRLVDGALVVRFGEAASR